MHVKWNLNEVHLEIYMKILYQIYNNWMLNKVMQLWNESIYWGF